MKKGFCTVITEDYYVYALVLHASLTRNSSFPVVLNVLVTDLNPDKSKLAGIEASHKGIKFFYRDELNSDIESELFIKYYRYQFNAYRWSLKPVFLKYLLEFEKYDSLLYLDADLFFTNSINFIFELLQRSNVLLTPHWKCSTNPEASLSEFKDNFMYGIYNAGFIGISREGINAMHVWAKMCLAECKVNRGEGLFYDQKYLDILHSKFEGVEILRHRGCNVAYWNRIECARVKTEEGEVYINGSYPIIFIHFTHKTMIDILTGLDNLLIPYLNEYFSEIKKFDTNLNIELLLKAQIEKKKKEEIAKMKRESTILYKIRMKLSIGRRILRFINLNY